MNSSPSRPRRASSVWRNWAGNQSARPRRIVVPGSAEEVSAEVRRAAGKGLRVRAVGAGHSFTAAAATDGVLIRPEGLAEVHSVDAAAGVVTVGSGMRLSRLNEVLAGLGLALTNMGELDVSSLAGATATGAHGTGRDSGVLSTLVVGMEMVLASGEIVTCSARENAELFAGARVSLGALGVVTALTLTVEPAFLLHAREEPMPLEEVLACFPDLCTREEHVGFQWFPHTNSCVLTRANRADGPSGPRSRTRHAFDLGGRSGVAFALARRIGRAAPRTVPTLARLSSRSLSARGYTDASHRVFTREQRVPFVGTEYALPRGAAVAALGELRRWVESSGERVPLPVGVRVAPADDLWLSPAYGRDTVYVAAQMYRGTPHERYFTGVEEVMTAHGGRPHWGQLHTLDADRLAPLYPRFDDFRALRDRIDPHRRFGNDHLRRVLGE